MDRRAAPRIFVAVLLGAALATGGSARAEEPTAEGDDGTKRELALQLLRASGGGDMEDQIVQVLLASMRQNYAAMIDSRVASQPDLSEEERRAVEARLSDFDRFAVLYHERMREAVDFDAILVEAYVPLYERYFTEDELRQILAFQTSPVGHKAATLMPQLAQEGMAASMPLLQPVLTQLTAEILEEQQAIALEEAP